MKKTILIFGFIFFSVSVFAQQYCDAYFYILPKYRSYLRVDNELIVKLDTTALPFVIQLDTGQHLIEIWNIGYHFYTDTIQVDTGKVNRFSIGITDQNKILKTYQRSMRQYYTKQSCKAWATLGIGLLNTWHTQNSIADILEEQQRIDVIYEEIKEAKYNYEHAIGIQDISLYKTEYEELSADYLQSERDYNKLITTKILTHTGAYLASAGLTYYLFKIKVKRPKYPKVPNPFYTHSSIQLSPTQIGLTVKF